MIQTYDLQAGGYYMVESLSSGRSCYFESDKEVRQFKVLFQRYLGHYCKVHKMYLSSEGYRIMLQVREKGVLCKRYREHCRRNGNEVRKIFLEEEWRIVSERVRIFHSVYVKMVNRERGRQGVLVQSRYNRYYFESMTEYENYIERMDEGEEIKGQRKEKYGVSGRWKARVRWVVYRGGEWVESCMDKGFKDYVVEKLLLNTLFLHKPPDLT